jgi:hypothetical protein
MKKLIARSLAVLALLLAAACFGGCDLFSTQVRYEADCTFGSMNVTIIDEDGEFAFLDNQGGSWQYVFELDNDAADVLLYVAAENLGSGTVSVRIYLDGSLLAADSNSTAYGTARATGSFN